MLSAGELYTAQASRAKAELISVRFNCWTESSELHHLKNTHLLWKHCKVRLAKNAELVKCSFSSPQMKTLGTADNLTSLEEDKCQRPSQAWATQARPCRKTHQAQSAGFREVELPQCKLLAAREEMQIPANVKQGKNYSPFLFMNSALAPHYAVELIALFPPHLLFLLKDNVL
ncbi:hypothetical protein AOLI_G00054160 [Acnodon oligacanthus]